MNIPWYLPIYDWVLICILLEKMMGGFPTKTIQLWIKEAKFKTSSLKTISSVKTISISKTEWFSLHQGH